MNASGGTGAPPPAFWGDVSSIPAARHVMEFMIQTRPTASNPDSQVYWSFNGQTMSIAQQRYIHMPASSAGRPVHARFAAWFDRT